ncbi:MAG: sulfite exporter TauE/SafE family protein [Hyphomicrobiaceae bacterium]
MWTAETLCLVAVTFFVAGCVKGVVGLGLPTVTLAVLTATLGLKPAMGLLIAPSLVTNAWQAVVGSSFWMLMRRLAWLLLAVAVFTWLGVRVLATTKTAWLSALFGGLLIVYASTGLVRPVIPDLRRHETWLSPLIGGINGILTGMTGSFVVPGVLYLQSLQLNKNELVQAMGILFTASTLVLGIALGGERLISGELALLSCFGIVPAMIGMIAGQNIRQRLDEAQFRQILFLVLLVLGFYILVRALTA